jgi:hypothetical protein
MIVSMTYNSMSREQIAAEIALMRKAAREIARSPRKRLQFLRDVGVLQAAAKRPRPKRKAAAASRNS